MFYKQYCFYIIGFMALSWLGACGGKDLRTGDLAFAYSGQSDMSEAIAEATCNNTVSFDHVGIVIAGNGGVRVVDASPKLGVAVRPMAEFMREAPHGVAIMRVSDEIDAEAAASRALALVGRPYDWLFAVGDSAVYCSELVQLAYLDAGGKMVFPYVAMNFYDSAGNLPEFWQRLFHEQGCAVPQGQRGTNPAALARSPLLSKIMDF